MNENFVYLKLVTGEQLMAYKESEDTKSMTLKFPMLIKTHLVGANNGRISEQVTAGPYTLFVDSTTLHINKEHVVLDAQLSDKAIPHYVHLVKDHEGVTLSYTSQSLQWEDEIPDEVSMLGSLDEPQEELSDEEVNFIEGNDTVH